MVIRITLLAIACLPLLSETAAAQYPPTNRQMSPAMTNALYDRELNYTIPAAAPITARAGSWIHIDPVLPPTIKLHDIITIVVDEKSELTLRSGFNRQRTSNLKAELKDFIRISKSGRLTNAAEDQPTIDGNVTERMQTTGNVTDQEGLRTRIAAQVVNVLPNGNVVIVARKSIRSDRDVWQYMLTGILKSSDVRRDGTALSDSIANLNIVKKRAGKVSDSTKRRWGQRLIDMFWPF